MRYLSILPQDRGSDGKYDWSAVRFCFDEEVRPLPRTRKYLNVTLTEVPQRLLRIIGGGVYLESYTRGGAIPNEMGPS